MAFPQRAAVATSNEPSNTVTHTIILPSGIVADSLVLVFVGTDGDISWSNLNGFTELFSMNNGTAGSCSVMYKYCTGGETTVDFISNESEVSTHISWRITGDAGSGRIPEVSTGVAINDQYPNPDLCTPTGGAKDYLWIACEGNDDDDAATAYPLPDNNSTNIDSGGCGVSVCSDELNQASLDPGTFTLAGTEQWVACTVVVHPVGLTYKTLIGTIGSASDIPDVPLKRVREFVSVAVAGVSNIVDAPLKILREFVGETVAGVSGIADVMFGRIRKFIGESVTGVSGIADVPLTKLKGFVGETVQGISSLIADITVTAGEVVKAFIGSIGAISGIADVPLKRIREYIGSVGGVSDIADTPLKRLREFVGEIISPDLLIDGGLNIWTSPTDLTNWMEASSGSSTVNREASEKIEGDYSCRFDVDGSNENVEIKSETIVLTPSTTVKISFWYKMSVVGKTAKWRIQDTGSNVYLLYDGTWGGSSAINLPNQTSWTKMSMVFTVHPDYTDYILGFFRSDSASSSIYFDDISFRKTNSQISGVFKRIRKFIGKLAGLETVYEWIAGQPSPSQGKIDWVAGQPFVEVKYGQSESSVSGTLKRVKAFIGSIGSISGVEGIFTGVFKFIGTTVEGISSVLADITVILGGGVQAFIGAVGGISDVLGNLTGTFSLSGSVGAVSGIADTVLKRIRKFVGEIISPDELTDGGLNIWNDAVDLTNWSESISGSSTVNRESTEKIEGDYSCRFDVDGVNSFVSITETNISISVDGDYVLSFWYKNSLADKIAQCRLFDTVANVYLMEDGAWTDAAYGILIPNSLSWVKFEVQFRKHPDYSVYTLALRRNVSASSSIYWDDISIRESNSQVSAILKRARKFIGETVEGLSGVSGVLKVLKKFIGVTVEGISNITGLFTTLGTVLFQGLVEGFSGVTGVIKGTFTFIGSVGGVSGVADAPLKRLREFVGVSIDAVSNIADASLERIRKFIGTVGSLSGVDAVLKRIRRFTAPVITGISNIIAPLTKGAEVILQGVVGAISSIDANILVDYVLSGVTGAVSGVDAALGRVRTFIGTIGSLSGVDAVLGRVRKFVGETVQGISSVLGNIQKGAIKAFIGTIGVISNIADAPLKILREFIGSIGSISGVTGALSVIYKFIGETVQGVSSVLGELSKLGTIVLRGTIGAISAVDGALKATFSLKGDAEGLSGVTGLMKYTASFSGLVEALSGLTGTIVTAATVVFQGVIGSFSNVIGDIKRFRGLTATISALSGVDAVMKRIRAYIASVNVFSGVNSILKRLRRLSGSLLSTTAVDGYVKILYRFIGSIASASIITATFGRVKKFVGVTISAVSSVAGNLWAGVLYIFPIIFAVVPRVKAFLIEARDRIFKSNINKDR